MADFEEIIKKHAGEDGSIPAETVQTLATAIKKAVGEEFVAKDRYKAKLTEIDELNTKLHTAEDKVTTAESWKKKYEESEKAFSDYKADQDAKATEETKKKAYKSLLKEAGLADKWSDRAMKGVSFTDMELGDDGKFKNAEELLKGIKKEWSDCIETEDKRGADTAKPPYNQSHVNKQPSRAAEIARKYHENLYGSSNKEE